MLKSGFSFTSLRYIWSSLFEQVDDKLYIYLEYVSGGSIHKLLQDYGQFGELAIRSFTQQILSGLAYLHAMNTVHRWMYILNSVSNFKAIANSSYKLAGSFEFVDHCVSGVHLDAYADQE